MTGPHAEPDYGSLSTSELKAMLTGMPQVYRDMKQRHYDLMRLAREKGVTWADIARLMNLGSAQAAQARYLRYERVLATPEPPRCGECGKPL